jgi:hypothetical protein
MKLFAVVGIKKREFRGNFQPITIADEVEAKDKREAGEKSEKANPEYKAMDIEETAPKIEKKTKKETGISGSNDEKTPPVFTRPGYGQPEE